MKMTLIFALAGLAIGFAAPTLAQEKDAVDPQMRQQLEAIDKIFDEAYNKNDAAATARSSCSMSALSHVTIPSDYP